MLKRTVLAGVAVFVTLSILDFVIHGMLLEPIYQATADLWRPMDEMNMALMYGVTLAVTACFVALYAHLFTSKSVLAGIKLGTLFGLATGISMGFGSYGYMPIPLSLAWSWFLGVLTEFVIAGAIVGALVKSGEGAS